MKEANQERSHQHHNHLYEVKLKYIIFLVHDPSWPLTRIFVWRRWGFKEEEKEEEDLTCPKSPSSSVVNKPNSSAARSPDQRTGGLGFDSYRGLRFFVIPHSWKLIFHLSIQSWIFSFKEVKLELIKSLFYFQVKLLLWFFEVDWSSRNLFITHCLLLCLS